MEYKLMIVEGVSDELIENLCGCIPLISQDNQVVFYLDLLEDLEEWIVDELYQHDYSYA